MATKRPRSDSLASESECDDEVIDLTVNEPAAAAAPPVRAPTAAGSRQHEENFATDAGPSLPGTCQYKDYV